MIKQRWVSLKNPASFNLCGKKQYICEFMHWFFPLHTADLHKEHNSTNRRAVNSWQYHGWEKWETVSEKERDGGRKIKLLQYPYTVEPWTAWLTGVWRERERRREGGWEGSRLDEEQAVRQAAASSLLWRAAEGTGRLEPCRVLTPRRRAQRHRLSRTGRRRDSLFHRRSTACCSGTMAQAAKQIRKNKDLQELAAQELREKEEEKIKKRNRSRDRRRKVTKKSILLAPSSFFRSEGNTHTPSHISLTHCVNQSARAGRSQIMFKEDARLVEWMRGGHDWDDWLSSPLVLREHPVWSI